MRNPVFNAILDDIKDLHDRKNHDYAEDGNPYSNFEQAATVAEGFTGIDAVYATLIGIKLARLRQLTRAGKSPANESIDDTRRDLIAYTTLWAAHSQAVRPAATFITNERPNGNTPDHEQATYASVQDATGFSMADPLTYDERRLAAQPCLGGCGKIIQNATTCLPCRSLKVPSW